MIYFNQGKGIPKTNKTKRGKQNGNDSKGLNKIMYRKCKNYQ